jgi:hypothetical protein
MISSIFSGLVIFIDTADAGVVEAGTPYYQMGNGPNDLALADINGDDYPDLITVNSLEANFYVRMNDGYGNFLDRTQHSISYTSRSLQVADVDGINGPDVIICSSNNHAVTIMYNLDGLGNFGNEVNIPVGWSPYTLALADFNNDTHLDIVTANYGDFSNDDVNVTVLTNDGSGNFGVVNNYIVGLKPRSVGAMDVNGDNFPDIVCTHPTENDISVLMNDEMGGFDDLTTFPVDYRPDFLDLGDIDGDNDNDIVFTVGDEGKLVVMKNDFFGNFSFDNYFVIGYDWGNYNRIKLADLDSDGDLDAVVPIYDDSIVYVLMNDGDGGFRTSYKYPSGRGPWSITIGDVNLDGNIDFATCENYPPTQPSPPGRVSIFYNQGNGWFNLLFKYHTSSSPEMIDLGDIDNDGDLDVATVNYQTATATIYFNRGDGSYGFETEYSTYSWPNSVRLGDVNADGYLDLVTGAGGGLTLAYVWVRMNNGDGTFGAETSYQMGKYPQVYLALANGDTYLDMITVNRGDSDISVRFNNAGSPGNFLARNDYSGSLNQPRDLYMGDVNGDLRDDIVVANTYDDSVEVFRNNGGGAFTSSVVYPTGDFPNAVVFADVDRDDDLDIASADANGDSITVLLNNGAGFFYEGAVTYPVGDNPKSIDAGDVDGDGHNDLICGNTGDNTISIIKNNGFGGFGFREDYTSMPVPKSVRLGDIDNDVDLDIAYGTSGIGFIFNRNSIDFHMDTDSDGYPDYEDDFPENPTEWIDSDGDGYGDNADQVPWDPFEHVDADGDRHGDQFDDAFPQDPNEWQDSDGDGWGDNSDAFPQDNTEWLDSDGDHTGDNADFMPYDDSQKRDTDGDGHGDNPYGTNGDMYPTDSTEWWDTDGDNFGDNFQDAFPNDETQWSDKDGDGYGDNLNGNNPDLFRNNPVEWEDSDDDGIGDNSDTDDDNDGFSDTLEQGYGTDMYNPDDHPPDFDGDFSPDDKDEDDDNDGVSDTLEQNLGYDSKNANDFPPDNDGDGIPDPVDEDDDNDGWTDGNDAFPKNPAGWKDTDSDGKPDMLDENAVNPTGLVEDMDDDDDTFLDTVDDFPENPNEWLDTDSDGVGDNTDSDIDNDGWSNTIEEAAGSDPMDKDDMPLDTDSDGVADNADLDDDNDGFPDYDDFAPLDASVTKDPNLIRIAGVEFEIGELVMGIMMAVGAVLIGALVFTRKKRLYTKYSQKIEASNSVDELNAVNSDMKSDIEKERLTYIQLTSLKEHYDDRYMQLREAELEDKFGKLPARVEDRIRDIISDKIITEDEFEGMEKWLLRLRDSKDFDSGKKAKLQEVLKDWIDENVEQE